MNRLCPVAVVVLCVCALGFAQSVPSTLTCNHTLSPAAPHNVPITCTFQHQEFSGVTTRKFAVWVNDGYAPGQSWEIFKILGTTHQVAADCPRKPALSELSGWVPFLETVVKPGAGILVCPENLLITGTVNNGERINTWGFHKWPWAIPGVDPDDIDFYATVATTVQTLMQLGPGVMVTNDWWPEGVIAAHQFAAMRPDVVTSLALYNDNLFANLTGVAPNQVVDTDGTLIPPPRAAVPVMLVVGTSGTAMAVCGGRGAVVGHGAYTRNYTVDDTVAYWEQANHPDTVNTFPASAGGKFCRGLGNANVTGLEKYVSYDAANPGRTEIQVLRLLGNVRSTPVGSFAYDGSVSAAVANLVADPPKDFRMPPATGKSGSPGNHYVAAPEHFLLRLLYDFGEAHRQ